jgi:hypothetical protein
LKNELKEDSRKALWSKSIESMWAADIAEGRKEKMLDDPKRRGGENQYKGIRKCKER